MFVVKFPRPPPPPSLSPQLVIEWTSSLTGLGAADHLSGTDVAGDHMFVCLDATLRVFCEHD